MADRHRIAGVPVMSICAVVFLAFVIFIDYECFTKDALAVNGWKALVFVGVLYAIALVTYVGSNVYRRRKENFDISVVYKELPVE